MVSEDKLVVNGKTEKMPLLQLKDSEPSKILVSVTREGVLEVFDNKECRSIADMHNPDNHNDVTAVALVISTILDEAAKEVDHILMEGGGTYGDAIRNFSVNKKAPN